MCIYIHTNKYIYIVQTHTHGRLLIYIIILLWRQAARLTQSTKIGLSFTTRDLCSTDSPVLCASCGFFEAESARSVPPRERVLY